MSILCDKTITELCLADTQVLDVGKFELEKFKLLMGFAKEDHEGSRDYNASIQTEIESLRGRYYRHRTQREMDEFRPMIEPFHAGQIKTLLVKHQAPDLEYRDQSVPMPPKTASELAIISRGLTSYGYDVALAPEFKVFSNINSAVIDPKRIDPKCFVDVQAQIDEETGESYVLMPPNSYLLGRTIEHFDIPRDVMVICLGKSTYARSGGIVNVTPIEPGFRGNVVIEISNATNLPARVYANEGIAQFLFLRGDRPCGISYGDRGGKYQDQTGITLPKV